MKDNICQTQSKNGHSCEKSSHSNFPKAILSFGREEFYGQTSSNMPLCLTVKDGQDQESSIPRDLEGHLFVIGGVGSAASDVVLGKNQDKTVLPSSDGWTALLNGDGMIYRVDFHQTPVTPYSDEPTEDTSMKKEIGKVWLTTRIVKPLSYFADKATAPPPTVISSEVSSELICKNKEDTIEAKKEKSSSISKNRERKEEEKEKEKERKIKFQNWGIARFSFILGICNQVNTALQPFKFRDAGHERLLVTNDASRPYEVDPFTLKTISPVGLNKDWHPVVKIPILPKFPFQGVMSTAHPCYDPISKEIFFVNVQKSIRDLIRIPLSSFKDGVREDRLVELFDLFIEGLIWLAQIVTAILAFAWPASRSATFIMCWKESTQKSEKREVITKRKIFLPDHSPVKIRQSTHMMGITENHILIVDTGFKLGPVEMIPTGLIHNLRWQLAKFSFRKREEFVDSFLTPEEKEKKDRIEKRVEDKLDALKENLTYPQSHETQVYIINRKQLKKTIDGQGVIALPVSIKGEFAHFLTDYRETDSGKIVIHPGMSYGTDPAEFIRIIDDPVFSDDKICSDDEKLQDNKKNSKLKNIAGMWTAPTDVNAPAVIIIDPTAKEAPKKYELNLADCVQKCILLGLYAYRDDLPTQQIDSIYWVGGGGWKETLSQQIYNLYENSEYRRLAAKEVIKLIQNEQPVSLFRINIDRGKLEGSDPDSSIYIKDSFSFPNKYIANSIQYIPRKSSKESDKANLRSGYIACVVVHSDQIISTEGEEDKWSSNSEIWIFDSNNLAQGPLYKLSHPRLNFGLTIHAAWMKNIYPYKKDDANGHYDVSKDFEEQIKCTRAFYKNLLFLPGLSRRITKQLEDIFPEIYSDFRNQ